MKTVTAKALNATLPDTARVALFLIVSLALAIFALISDAQARDSANLAEVSSRSRKIDLEGVSVWMDRKFSETEQAALRPDDLRMESHECSCADLPNPHFPYIVVLFKTPKGDLVGRPDRRGLDVVITRLAVRHGEQYCDVDSEDRCFGRFSHPCEFTDFRYGPYLAEYFPYCKMSDEELGLLPVKY